MTAVALRFPLRVRVKEWILQLSYVCGLLWLLARLRLRNRAIVLTYHRVLPAIRMAASFSSPGICVTPETFDRQMAFLRRHFRPLTPEEFAALLQPGAALPSGACLVTFDDGWHDFLEFALPILERHGVPAILFVPTGQVGGSGGFWQERLARLLSTYRDDTRIVPLLTKHAGLAECDVRTLSDHDAIAQWIARVKQYPLPVIDTLLEALEALHGNGLDGGEDRFLDWDGLRRIAATGVVRIGSHAVSHRPLTRIPLAEVRLELLESRQQLLEQLGSVSSLHAYPNGDANDAIAAAAAAAGYRAAFTTTRGLVGPGADRYRLNRINIHEAATRTPGTFLARVLGLA